MTKAIAKQVIRICDFMIGYHGTELTNAVLFFPMCILIVGLFSMTLVCFS